MTWTAHSTDWDGGTGYGVCWSPDLGRFVMVGVGGSEEIQWSEDGVTWTSVSSPLDGVSFSKGFSVCWAPSLGLFVVGGRKSLTPAVVLVTSPDGETWTAQTTGWEGVLGARVQGVAWSDEQGLLVATGSNGGSETVMFSSDAVTWTNASVLPGYSYGTCVSYSPKIDLWVAGGSGGSAAIATSSDGDVWTDQLTTFDGYGVNAVAWCAVPPRFVAGGYSGSDPDVISTSPDGVTWTPRSSSFETAVTAVAVGQSLILAGDGNGNGAKSHDSVTWEDMPVALNYEVWGYAYAPEIETWVGVGRRDVTDEVVMTSPLIPIVDTQYQRIYGWRLNISDDALETVDPMLTSPDGGTNA